MYKFFDRLSTDDGKALPGYQVRIMTTEPEVAVNIFADESGTPIENVSGVPNAAITDNGGNYQFFVEPGTYNIVFSSPGGTFLDRIRAVPMLTGPKGDTGDTGGPRALTTLADLKAALTGDDTFIYDSAPFKWTTGNFTGQNDDINIVKSDFFAITAGAWVRQDAGKVAYKAEGATAAQLSLSDKARQIRSAEDYVGGDDLAKIQAAIDAASAGDTVILTKGEYILSGTVALKSGVRLDLNGSVLTGQVGSQFEYLVTGTDCVNTRIVNGTLDVNALARIGAGTQTTRMCGIAWLGTSTNCVGVDMIARGALGFNTIPGIIFASSGSTFRCGFSNCIAEDGGTADRAADGFFMSGFAPYVINSQAKDCWDTGFVLESCDYGLVVGCTSLRCSAAGAITNARAESKRGNRIIGLTGSEWLSTNTGGIQIGVPNSATGDLIDSFVDCILTVTEVGRGLGSAIRVRQEGFGRVKGLTIRARIDGVTGQGILVDGDDVNIQADIKNTADGAIQFQTGSSGRVYNSKTTGGSFGLVTAGTAVVDATNCDFNGAGYGAYAFGTSTINLSNCRTVGNTTAATGKDGGATLTRAEMRDGVFRVDGSQVVGARKTGWTAATGTVSRGTYATYSSPGASATYTQAELEGVMTALQNTSRRLAALEADNRQHGLIN